MKIPIEWCILDTLFYQIDIWNEAMNLSYELSKRAIVDIYDCIEGKLF